MKVCPDCNLRYPDDATICPLDGGSPILIADPRLGTTVGGRYIIEAVIGEGAMASVYRARNKLTDELCAVKIMSAVLAKDRTVRERFRREAKAAEMLAHPNIIEIFEHGDTEDGSAYLAMELLRGETLAGVIGRGGMTLGRALGLMVQMSRALGRAHDFLVVHRDLKPENIFVSVGPNGEDVVKLLDFGIARSMQESRRLTGTGEVFGTPQYIAPERITSIHAGPPADLYALGVIFFAVVSGQLPFDAPNVPSLFLKHMKEPPPKLRMLAPEAPASLEALIEHLLAKDPDDRPADAHAVTATLIAICAETGCDAPTDRHVSVRPATAPSSRDPWTQRLAALDIVVTRAFPAGRPLETQRLLGDAARRAQAVSALLETADAEQKVLESVEARERDGRLRFGQAMDATAADLSGARQRLRATTERIPSLRASTQARGEDALRAHADICRWLAEHTLVEPVRQLTAAYRLTADLMDAWASSREAEADAIASIPARERAIADLEFQVGELRGALERFEQSIAEEKAKTKAALSEISGRLDALNAEITAIESAVISPLRARSDIRPLLDEITAGRRKPRALAG